MSWLTTCPHCRTTFRVGREQLAARGGDVRCGKCRRVFNARLALKPEEEPEAAPVHEAPEAVAEPPPFRRGLPEKPVSPPEEAAPVEEAAVEEIEITALPEAAPAEPAASPFAESGEPAFAPAAAEAPPEKPRRSLAWLWGVAALLLLLALAVQALVAFRVELAARSPAIKPLLVQLCGVLQCRVSLPRHAETLGIEGSNLQADPQRPGVLVMSAVLRSRADYAQEYPLLELTLTDTADKAVARRVFRPAEYLPRGRDPAAGMPGGGEVAVRLNLGVGDLRPVGYRLYLFYPRNAAGDS